MSAELWAVDPAEQTRRRDAAAVHDAGLLVHVDADSAVLVVRGQCRVFLRPGDALALARVLERAGQEALRFQRPITRVLCS